MTGTLVGATFVQPNLVEYQGKKSLVFVFAVRRTSPHSPHPLSVLCDLCDVVLNMYWGLSVYFRTLLLKQKAISYFAIGSLISILDQG